MASKMLQFLFISSPFGSVWYLWKLYVDEPLTDSFVSQSNEHHFQKKQMKADWFDATESSTKALRSTSCHILMGWHVRRAMATVGI